MSYCRFSSDNWRSDLYVWGGADGIVVCVAGNRRMGPLMNDFWPTDWGNDAQVKMWAKSHQAQMAALESCSTVFIDHPESGAMDTYADARDALERLVYLRNEGFHVPQFALDRLAEEALEEEAGGYA
jgi:hypothetical protein